MSILYKEKNRFIIREITNEQIMVYLDPVIQIIIKLINTHNESFIQYIGEQQLLTNDVKKIIELIDIRIGFFKSFIQYQIIQSKYSYYNTFEAFITCKLIRDFSMLGNNYSVVEKIQFIKDGEEILYRVMKQLRIVHNNQSIKQLINQNLNQIINYSDIIIDVYQNYIQLYQDLFIQGKYYLNFVNIKSSFYDFKVYNDSYALEISEKNLVLSQFIQNKDDIYVKDIILCDFYPTYQQFKQDIFRNKNHIYLLVITAVIDQQEIDSFYSLQNILIICNVSLKNIRELSFVFGLKVNQSYKNVENVYFNQQFSSEDNNQNKIIDNISKFKVKILYRQNIEFNRRESELFHLKNRIPLLITYNQLQDNIKKQVLTTVISVPSSLSHKQQSISQRIEKQFSKLRNVLMSKKLAKGRGEFENSISNLLKEYIHKNPYILVLCQCLHDYYSYIVNSEQKIADDISNITFYDDYTQKKQILKKAHQTLKMQVLSNIEMQFDVQKKNLIQNQTE